MSTELDRRLTHSQIQTYRGCPRKHQLAYVLGLRRDEEHEALRIGSAIHKALELSDELGGFTMEVVDRATALYNDLINNSTEEWGPDYYRREREVVYRLLCGYYWRWKEMDQQIEVVANEQVFEMPIVNPETGRSSRNFVATGKIDKVVRWNGKLWVMEHKTRKGPISIQTDSGAKYWKRLRIDHQISMYMLAARSMGHDVHGVLYNVIRKNTASPSALTQAETAKLLTTGIYETKKRGVEELLFVNEYKIDTDAVYTEAGKIAKDGLPSRLLINGEDVFGKIKWGAQGIAIAETVEMMGDRILAEISADYSSYFDRQEIVRTAEDLKEFQYDLWRSAQEIRESEKSGIWPRNTSACVGFGTCPYFDLCTSSWKPGDEILPPGFKVVGDVHQELIED